jgi:integrase
MRKISPTTVIRIRTLLYSAMKYAEKEGVVGKNVVALADRPKPDPHHFSVFDPEELRLLICRSVGDDLFIPVLLAASLGLRREEVLGLCWRNVSFKENYVAIESTVVECDQDGKMKIIAKEGMKTKSSWRRLPMPEILRNALAWQKRKSSPKRDERLCKRSDGSDITPGFVTSHFPILLKRLGLPKIRFHDLRHSLATAMRAKGTDMSVIQHWLGHSLITTTESIYAHFDAEMLKPALKNVNQILSGRKGQRDTIDEAPNRPLKIDALS